MTWVRYLALPANGQNPVPSANAPLSRDIMKTSLIATASCASQQPPCARRGGTRCDTNANMTRVRAMLDARVARDA
eukprot:1261616-Pyramimonas_sp.AAC.1